MPCSENRRKALRLTRAGPKTVRPGAITSAGDPENGKSRDLSDLLGQPNRLREKILVMISHHVM